MPPSKVDLNRRISLQRLGEAALSAFGVTALSGSALADPVEVPPIARRAAPPSRLDAGVLDPSWPPPRALEVWVPEGKGGNGEALCKAMAPRLKEAFALNTQFRMMGDASPIEVLQQAARGTIDGASLAYIDQRSLILEPALTVGAKFALGDFHPVTWLASRPYLFCTNRRVISKNLREWLARAVERPGVMNFGSAGRGTPGHLVAEALLMDAGVQTQHVPYPSERHAVIAAIANEVQAVILDPVIAVPEIKAGRLRALAVTSSRRLDGMPEIRTAAAQGVTGFNAVQWAGFAMPRGVAEVTVTKMHAVLSRAVDDHDTQHDLLKSYWQPVGEGPEAFSNMIRSENERWNTLVRRLGLRAS